jgi:hypothetical protein
LRTRSQFTTIGKPLKVLRDLPTKSLRSILEKTLQVSAAFGWANLLVGTFSVGEGVSAISLRNELFHVLHDPDEKPRASVRLTDEKTMGAAHRDPCAVRVHECVRHFRVESDSVFQYSEGEAVQVCRDGFSHPCMEFFL